MYHTTSYKINNIICWGLLLFLGLGCKKVDKNDALLHKVYSVLREGNLYRADGSFFYYQYGNTANTIVPGDTLTIGGILGGADAHRVVSIGDSTLDIIYQTQFRRPNKSIGDTAWITIDYLKCIVKKGLLTGNNVPVTITVNGTTVDAPSIKLQQFTSIPGATDTTLVVEKVAAWMPDKPDTYAGLSLWRSGVVTSAGNIWFYNQPGGIFKISNGATSSVLRTGTHVTPSTGTAFDVVSIIGFTVDMDETAVYFSASTKEATADTALYYITRFCRMDPASGAVTVLNRSLFMKPAASYQRSSDLVTLQYDPSKNYLPAEGNLADAKLALGNLQVALDGTLLASNFAYNTVVTPKSPLAGNPKFPQFSDPAWYASRDSFAARTWYGYGTGNITSGVNNFVRIRSGQVKSLAKPYASAPVPGNAIFFYSGQQMSPGGRFIYQVYSPAAQLHIISTEDMEEEVVGQPGYEFSFSSVDTTATGYHHPTVMLQSANFVNYYILSNGDGVFFPGGYGYPGKSLLSVNFSKHNAYAYAGTEIGINRDDVPGQDQTTGKTKWVNFSPLRRGLEGANFFIGFDRHNNLYFRSMNTTGFGAKVQPMEIYRIKKH